MAFKQRQLDVRFNPKPNSWNVCSSHTMRHHIWNSTPLFLWTLSRQNDGHWFVWTVSCCLLQFVDSNLTAQITYLGFYSACDSSAETWFLCIKYIFLCLNSNLSGHLNGFQAKLKAECPGSLYVHCSNHTLDLILQEATREVRLIADFVWLDGAFTLVPFHASSTHMMHLETLKTLEKAKTMRGETKA